MQVDAARLGGPAVISGTKNQRQIWLTGAQAPWLPAHPEHGRDLALGAGLSPVGSPARCADHPRGDSWAGGTDPLRLWLAPHRSLAGATDPSRCPARQLHLKIQALKWDRQLSDQARFEVPELTLPRHLCGPLQAGGAAITMTKVMQTRRLVCCSHEAGQA